MSGAASLQSSCTGRPYNLPHRSVETLGREPRLEPRARMQIVSGVLSSLGFRVWGSGFRVWGLGNALLNM